MHLNDLFDGLTILKSLMQLLDNFATLVKPCESFSEFLLRKCLRSSLDIHIYRSFSESKIRYRALNGVFFNLFFLTPPHTHTDEYSRKHRL